MNETSSPWPARRVLVTGCTGFLGTAVVRELLGRGAEVVGLVRDRAAAAEFTRHRLTGRVHLVHGRAEDLFRVHSALAVHEVRAVFHMTDDPRATVTVLDATRRYDSRVPVVLARPEGVAFTAPAGQPVGVARFGVLFGPGDRDASRVVPGTVAALLGGGRAGFAIEGPPRDFVAVRDAARACVMLAERLLVEPVPRVLEHTFRSGWARTDSEMADAVRDVFAGRVMLGTAAPPDALGWAPASGLVDALSETVAWCREDQRVRSFAPRQVQRTAA
jgi:nucleoside-diphosphate-sugar epimerase